MRRLVLVLLLLLIPALPASAADPSRARVTQVDTSRYPQVTIYVSVTDSSGQTLGGLRKEDFQLTEDGQRVAITDFAAGGAAQISTVLVIDRSGSMSEADKMEGATEAARAFVEQMRSGDQTAVIAFSDAPELVQPFTTNQKVLDRAIRNIDPGGATTLYDSLIAGVRQLDSVGGRRALLLLTDGRDQRRTDDPTRASTASLDEAIRTAVKSGISVQTIGLGDRNTSDERAGIDERVLRRIASETGGEYFYTPSGDELARLYRKLSADMHQEYRLTYHSPRPFYDGTRRDIQVQVGGMSAVGGSYVEQHMIQVRSAPLVGLLLLLPVLLALALPSLVLRRRGAGAQQAPASTTAPAAPSVVPGDVSRCTSCDTPLDPAGARFCSLCGADQRSAVQAGATVCAECGTTLRQGARFCNSCGAPV
jgi:VWFA-related protein